MLLAWTTIFVIVCGLIEIFVSDELGNRIADATSTWIYDSQPTNENQSAQEDAGDNIEQSTDSKTLTRTNSDPWQALEQGDTDFLYQYRDP